MELFNNGIYLVNGREIIDAADDAAVSAAGISVADKEAASKNTIAAGILDAHNREGDDRNLKIKFDMITSHDITYVGIIQTARASGLKSFPIPYVLTNCHNSLCAVGGTINEDDHFFGLSCAAKIGNSVCFGYICRPLLVTS